MSKDVAVLHSDMTRDQLELIKRTVAKDATDDELRLFVHDCQRQGVHPLDKLIHFTKRGGKYVPITSIDLMRTRAESTGEYLGCTKPVWTGKPGEKGSKVEMTAKRAVGVHIAEHHGEAHWDEYCPPPGQDMFWKKMPHVMLAKVCEAICLRRGFPKQLSGLYITEEMDQAKENDATSYAKAMTQDFPQNEWLEGTIQDVVMTTKPPQAIILKDGLLAYYDVLSNASSVMALKGKAIRYQYQRKSSRFILSACEPMQPATEAQTIEATTTPVPKEVVETVPLDEDEDFAAQYTRGTVEAAVEKLKKDGVPYGYLTISGIKGNFWHSPATAGVEHYQDLESQDVFYLKEENPSKDGKRIFTTFTEIIPADVFEQAMADRKQQLSEALDQQAEAES